jgi:predicted PurR-regulated permease PerM
MPAPEKSDGQGGAGVRKPRRLAVTDRGILIALLLVAAGWMATLLGPVILAMVGALILVGTLRPLVGWLESRGLGRITSLVAVFLAIFGGLVALGLLTFPALIAQVRELFEGAPLMQQRLAERLSRSRLTMPVANAIGSANLQELLIPSGKKAFEYSSDIVTALGWGATTLALAFYLLADPSTSQAALYLIVPRRFHVRLARIMLNLETIVGGYMRGQIITSALMGLFTYLLLRLCGAKNPLPLAVFAGVTDVLPLIGGILGAIPVVLATLPRGSALVVTVIVSMVVYQEIENRFIIPRVYGRVLRLPAWALTLALLVGAKLMGVLGALLSLPVAAGVRMILEELRVELPGDGAIDERLRDRDNRVESLYAELAAGAGAGTAAGIALDIADRVRRSDAADAADAADSAADADDADVAATEVPFEGDRTPR